MKLERISISWQRRKLSRGGALHWAMGSEDMQVEGAQNSGCELTVSDLGIYLREMSDPSSE